MTDLNACFQKHGLCAENILYIYRKDRKTVIQRTDGKHVALFVPVHNVLAALPESDFLSISKGMVVCRSQIVNISNDGIYTMSDGRTFQGRKRGMSSHRRLSAEIGLAETKPHPLSMLEKCSLLDDQNPFTIKFCKELNQNFDGMPLTGYGTKVVCDRDLQKMFLGLEKPEKFVQREVFGCTLNQEQYSQVLKWWIAATQNTYNEVGTEKGKSHLE